MADELGNRPHPLLQGLKTTVMASIPVAMVWWLSMVVLPKQFRTYIEQWDTNNRNGSLN